jgi:hypothetical protein
VRTDALGPEGRSVMQSRKGFVLAVAVTSISLTVFDSGTLYAKPIKPNPHKPVPATDTVLLPKISLRGRRAHGGTTTKTWAATGILGSRCEGNKYAIVIGISDYPGSMNDLEYADDDAVLMTRVLDEVYGFNNITTLIDWEATRESILGAIDDLQGVGPDDEVVFFFSGHGMSGIADDGDTERLDTAIVVNPAPDAPVFSNFEPIWDGELREAFCSCGTSRIIFIFDSCMAGGMDDLAGPDRVILMASSERGYAWEGEEWGYGDNEGNGEFTYYLAKGILEAGASVYDYFGYVFPMAAEVTVEEAFDYARTNCREDKPLIADDFTDDLLP